MSQTAHDSLAATTNWHKVPMNHLDQLDFFKSEPDLLRVGCVGDGFRQVELVDLLRISAAWGLHPFWRILGGGSRRVRLVGPGSSRGR